MLFFVKISMIIHCAQSDVEVILLDVTYAPGLKFNILSQHAVISIHDVTFNAEGVHLWMAISLFGVRTVGHK